MTQPQARQSLPPAEPQVWFITGVGSGLGRAIAKEAAARGHRVCATVRTQADRKSAEALGPPDKTAIHIADVTDRASIERAVAGAIARFGRIDVAVNNAGYGLIGAIEEADDAEIRRQFDVNVFGAIAVIQCVLPDMRRRRSGRILNISSVSGLAPWAGTGLYTASKYALEGIGQTLHQEVGELGIKVTNVEPGGLRTDFTGRSMQTVKRSIPDYDGAGHLPQKIYAEGAGKEPGDPVKAARAICDIAAVDDPPLHLLLGEDALHYVEGKLEALNADIERWKSVTVSIACDP